MLASPPDLDVSVVIPCLDEAGTVGRVVGEVREVMAATGYTFEVVVVDDGSEDTSAAEAAAAGARVVPTSGRRSGVGRAWQRGVEAAAGRWVVVLDADGEHDPAAIPDLLAPLGAGPALVLGSRALGGYDAGARGWLHRSLGTPALTGLINRYFGTRITDCNTGFRAFPRDAFLALGLRAPGFEAASELIALAALQGLALVEVPVRQRVGPTGRQPHLRRWRDGWRHLKTIVLHAPDRVLLRPGLMALALGALLFLPQLAGPVRLGPLIMDIHLMILGALLLFIGVEMTGSAAVCAALSGARGRGAGARSHRLALRFTLDQVLPVAAALFLAGLAGDLAVVVRSGLNGWQGIMEPRLALIGTTGMGIAVQLVVLSFVHTVVSQGPGARPPGDRGA